MPLIAAEARPLTGFPFSETGRTTFVNTLCGKTVLEGKDADDAANAHIEEGVRIKPVTVGKLASTITGFMPQGRSRLTWGWW